MRLAQTFLGRLAARTGKAQVPDALVQLLLLRLLRRNPIGLMGTILLRKALTGDGRVLGMDLASRRQARMAWLAGMLQRHRICGGDAAAAREELPVKSKLLR